MTGRRAATGRVTRRHQPLFYNGNFESFPASQTGTSTINRWIDGTSGGTFTDAGYGWAIGDIASSANASFSSTSPHSGSRALRLATATTTARVAVTSYRVSPGVVGELFKIAPGTTYTISYWVTTSTATASGVYLDFREYAIDGTQLVTSSATALGGTNAYTQITMVVTTSATTRFCSFIFRYNAGSVGSANFDDLTISPPIGINRVPRSGRVRV